MTTQLWCGNYVIMTMSMWKWKNWLCKVAKEKLWYSWVERTAWTKPVSIISSHCPGEMPANFHTCTTDIILSHHETGPSSISWSSGGWLAQLSMSTFTDPILEIFNGHIYSSLQTVNTVMFFSYFYVLWFNKKKKPHSQSCFKLL